MPDYRTQVARIILKHALRRSHFRTMVQLVREGIEIEQAPLSSASQYSDALEDIFMPSDASDTEQDETGNKEERAESKSPTPETLTSQTFRSQQSYAMFTILMNDLMTAVNETLEFLQKHQQPSHGFEPSQVPLKWKVTLLDNVIKAIVAMSKNWKPDSIWVQRLNYASEVNEGSSSLTLSPVKTDFAVARIFYKLKELKILTLMIDPHQTEKTIRVQLNETFAWTAPTQAHPEISKIHSRAHTKFSNTLKFSKTRQKYLRDAYLNDLRENLTYLSHFLPSLLKLLEDDPIRDVPTQIELLISSKRRQEKLISLKKREAQDLSLAMLCKVIVDKPEWFKDDEKLEHFVQNWLSSTRLDYGGTQYN